MEIETPEQCLEVLTNLIQTLPNIKDKEASTLEELCKCLKKSLKDEEYQVPLVYPHDFIRLAKKNPERREELEACNDFISDYVELTDIPDGGLEILDRINTMGGIGHELRKHEKGRKSNIEIKEIFDNKVDGEETASKEESDISHEIGTGVKPQPDVQDLDLSTLSIEPKDDVEVPDCYGQIDTWLDGIIVRIKDHNQSGEDILNEMDQLKLTFDKHQIVNKARCHILLSVVSREFSKLEGKISSKDPTVLPDLERISNIVKREIVSYSESLTNDKNQ